MLYVGGGPLPFAKTGRQSAHSLHSKCNWDHFIFSNYMKTQFLKIKVPVQCILSRRDHLIVIIFFCLFVLFTNSFITEMEGKVILLPTEKTESAWVDDVQYIIRAYTDLTDFLQSNITNFHSYRSWLSLLTIMEVKYLKRNIKYLLAENL